MPFQISRPVPVALAAGLLFAAGGVFAQPATSSNAKILTPSVSNEAPKYGGKAVVSSTPGPVAPAQAPIGTVAAEPTPAVPAGMDAGGMEGSTAPVGAAPAPLPVPAYGGPAQPYTREVVTGGDVLALPDGGAVTTVDTVRVPANVPRKGASMAQVRAAYGPPQSEYKTGGGSRAQPPITRWTYPGFNVVFEYTHAVDVVVPGAPPPLVRTGGLTSRPVNPANPQYKGTPGRALRLRSR